MRGFSSRFFLKTAVMGNHLSTQDFLCRFLLQLAKLLYIPQTKFIIRLRREMPQNHYLHRLSGIRSRVLQVGCQLQNANAELSGQL